MRPCTVRNLPCAKLLKVTIAHQNQLLHLDWLLRYAAARRSLANELQSACNRFDDVLSPVDGSDM